MLCTVSSSGERFIISQFCMRFGSIDHRVLQIMVVVLLLAVSPYIYGASAVAWDKETGAWAVVTNHDSGGNARGHAFTKCVNNGGKECKIISTCDAGYIAVATREVRGGRVIGAACGHDDELSARNAARKSCELRVAQMLGTIPADAPTQLPWSFIREKLIQGCPGMGNCRCSSQGLWRDHPD